MSASGKRERYFFKTKLEAETLCNQSRTRLQNFGRNSTTLTPGQLDDAAKAFERLKSHDVTLNEVVAEFLARRAAKNKSITFKELFERFVASRHDRSPSYLIGLKYTFPRFAALHERIVAEIQPAEVEREMEDMTASVKNSFMRNLRAIFNFGIKRDWLTVNPIVKLDFETVKKKEVVVLTVKEATALMLAAQRYLDLLPYHALGLFAGIRPLELERLEWGQVDMVERHIEITAEVSKTSRRRIINMEANLFEWLSRYVAMGGQMQGKVTPISNLRTQLRALRKEAGFESWHQDVMRHSYASYWLAKNTDINLLTLHMGHESTDMLWKHYHKACKQKDAECYWLIIPN